MSIGNKLLVFIGKKISDDDFLRRFNYFLTFVFLVISVSAFWPGMQIKGSDQASIGASMTTVSAIIFGIMGAWLSLMKLDAEKELEEKIPKWEGTGHIVKKIEDLSGIITVSCMILFFCIAQIFLYHALSKINFFIQYASVLKGISFSILVFLGLIQIKLIVKILLYGADQFLDILKLKDKLEDKHY